MQLSFYFVQNERYVSSDVFVSALSFLVNTVLLTDSAMAERYVSSYVFVSALSILVNRFDNGCKFFLHNDHLENVVRQTTIFLRPVL